MTRHGAATMAQRLALPFVIFAATYFLSAMLRAVTATLAPVFSQEFGLRSGELGLLAGAYFIGFAALQLPLGLALDRWGPRRTEGALLLLAVVGCALFSQADGLVQLVSARILIGMGVAACLMAPLTHFRREFDAVSQLRLNSWMLTAGSLGMLASTVPVQFVLPALGWRGVFSGLAVALGVACLAIAFGLREQPTSSGSARTGIAGNRDDGYRGIARHPVFLRLAPMGFVMYGGLIAMQTLWVGPWLTQVCGWTPEAASQGLLLVNAGMLIAFLVWGAVMPALHRLGLGAEQLLAAGVPVGLALQAWIAYAGPQAQAATWACWCMATSVLAVSQPAVGQAFPASMAGRALSGFNLVIFSGVFFVQWGIGLAIDRLREGGLSMEAAFRVALTGLLVLSGLTYLWYLGYPRRGKDNGRAAVVPS